MLVNAISAALAATADPDPHMLVETLNRNYAGFDLNDESSPLGVFVHVFDNQSEISGEPYLTTCNASCLSSYTSQCRVSTVLLNKVNGFMQDDWAYKKSMCSHFPQFCNISIGIWPGLAGKYYAMPGMVYGTAAGSKAAKCAFAFDGSSDMRPNRGCGCSIYQPDCAPNNPHWPCPNGHNACSVRDPLSKLHKITADSTVITACQCLKLNVTETINPIWMGKTSPTVDCFWQGPQFFHGQGDNQLRRALHQQHNFVENAPSPWNEVVLDGEAMNSAIAADPAHAVTAFFYPLTPGCQAAQCSNAAYAAQTKYRARYGVNLPVIGLDVSDGNAPFHVV